MSSTAILSESQAKSTPSSSAPRLLDWLGQLAPERGHPDDRVTAFTEWARRFILFHGKRHQRQLGGAGRLANHGGSRSDSRPDRRQ
jgi:hypothetical protein